MTVFLYAYTLALILICFGASTLLVATYVVSRRQSLLPQAAFFGFYILELIFIFGQEWSVQNLSFDLSGYYEIWPAPVLIFTGCGILESLWLVLLHVLDRSDNRALVFLPPVLFVVACLVIVYALPYGQVRQWLFYTMRQVWLLGGLVYAAICYFRSRDEQYRQRLERLRHMHALLCVCTLCILVEDALVMLVLPIPDPASGWLALFLSQRNFSENAMMLLVAYWTWRHSIEILSLRFNEPPEVAAASMVGDESPAAAKKALRLEDHIEEILPGFVATFGLSRREKEVLRLVIKGQDNRGIAQELVLSEGTIKTHVHNIMKKTKTANRDELKKVFWAS